MKLDSTFIFVLIAVMIPPLILLAALTWDRRQRKLTEKSPQSEKLLRPPGYSLAIRLDETFDSVIERLLIASILSAFAFSGMVTLAGLFGANAPAKYSIVCLVATAPFLVGCIWATLWAFLTFKKAQNMKLGLRGEQAVAESLNEAASSGFRAFHDLQTDQVGNIDHVAVGTRGVFLIESKARRKRGGNKGQAAHEVLYDGECLQFPHHRDTETIDQAKRNAVWLSNYLREATGDPVEVFPLVVLPGWFVKTVARGSLRVNVMAANYLPGYLSRESEKIQADKMRRILFALDKKCRDVEF
ncbi:MAG TPA: nuclease-related domain-containing protein [Verrucomicrobiae bacterium]|nr:nuclease-related domain-containing protein [Verrucomicrobiae bacterium]